MLCLFHLCLILKRLGTRVCLMQQFCGLWALCLPSGKMAAGWWRTACFICILFVCVHLGDTAAFLPKNSLFPLARPCSPPIFILILALSSLMPRVPFGPSHSFFFIFMWHHNHIFSSSQLYSRLQRSSGSVISKDIRARLTVRSSHQSSSEGWRSRFWNFFPRWVTFADNFVSLKSFSLCSSSRHSEKKKKDNSINSISD